MKTKLKQNALVAASKSKHIQANKNFARVRVNSPKAITRSTAYPKSPSHLVALKDEPVANNYAAELLLRNLTPWHFHALWLLLKDVNGTASANLLQAELFNPAKPREIAQVIEIGVALRLLMASSPSPQPTDAGCEFGALAHWRLWCPPRDISEILAQTGKAHWFYTHRWFQERPKVIDLFSGAGGLGLGFEMAGFQVVAAADNDSQAAAAHRLNFPGCAMLQDDITKLAKDPVRFFCTNNGIRRDEIAGIVGGPPCQGFSYIGERDVSDERNLLTSRFMDIVLGIEPDFFVLENVPGLLNSGSKPALSAYLKQLCKSIGAPASEIVDMLPPVPKAVHKRDRQFRKKLVSRIITDFAKSISKLVAAQRTPQELAATVPVACGNLNGTFRQEVRSAYGESHFEAALSALGRSSVKIALIAVTTIVSAALETRSFKKNDPECLLKEILQGAEAPTRALINRLLSEHHAAPEDVVFKGVRIGPVLHHLIQRASQTYDIAPPKVLSAAEFGSPQLRKRAFIIGFHKRSGKSFTYPSPAFHLPNTGKINGSLKSAPTCWQAIGDLPDVDHYPHLIKEATLPRKELGKPTSEFSAWMRLENLPLDDKSLVRATWNPFVIDCCKRTLHADYVLARLNALTEGEFDEGSHKTRLSRDRVSHTIRAGTKENKGSHTAVRPVHYEFHRVITVREAARLMGFPDWMTFHETKWHGFRLVGNGVPAQLGREVAAAIRRGLGIGC